MKGIPRQRIILLSHALFDLNFPRLCGQILWVLISFLMSWDRIYIAKSRTSFLVNHVLATEIRVIILGAITWCWSCFPHPTMIYKSHRLCFGTIFNWCWSNFLNFCRYVCELLYLICPIIMRMILITWLMSTKWKTLTTIWMMSVMIEKRKAQILMLMNSIRFVIYWLTIGFRFTHTDHYIIYKLLCLCVICFVYDMLKLRCLFLLYRVLMLGFIECLNSEWHYIQSSRIVDTTAAQARRGIDIQGIPWERLSITREKYRKTRLEQYKNYENIPNSGEGSEKVTDPSNLCAPLSLFKLSLVIPMFYLWIFQYDVNRIARWLIKHAHTMSFAEIQDLWNPPFFIFRYA